MRALVRTLLLASAGLGTTLSTRICFHTSGHANHRIKMVKILKSAKYSVSYPHDLAKMDAHVTRVCNGYYETKLELQSIYGHVDHMNIHMQNVKDAIMAIANSAQLSVTTVPAPPSVTRAPHLVPSP